MQITTKKPKKMFLYSLLFCLDFVYNVISWATKSRTLISGTKIQRLAIRRWLNKYWLILHGRLFQADLHI